MEAKFLMANGGGRFDWIEIDVAVPFTIYKLEHASQFLIDCDGKVRYV